MDLQKADTDIDTQVAWSIMLMLGIAIMVPVYITCTASGSDNDLLYNFLYFFPALTVLMLGYIFTYRGKEHLASRIVFAVLLVVSVIGFFILRRWWGWARHFLTDEKTKPFKQNLPGYINRVYYRHSY
jgi:hypothetical protein